jgi:hypothetical protein
MAGPEQRQAEGSLRRLLAAVAEPRAHTAAQAGVPALGAAPRVAVGAVDMWALLTEGARTKSGGWGWHPLAQATRGLLVD